jgi:hypothetical protein
MAAGFRFGAEFEIVLPRTGSGPRLWRPARAVGDRAVEPARLTEISLDAGDAERSAPERLSIRVVPNVDGARRH